MKGSILLTVILTFLFNGHAVGIVLDVNNHRAAALVAHGAQELYNGNKSGGTVGKWPFPPYYCKTQNQRLQVSSCGWHVKLPLDIAEPTRIYRVTTDKDHIGWESGGAWGSMMQYYLYTGDGSYNQVLYDALVAQVGPAYDFINAAQILDTGNDDQGFWAFTAMTAAEHNFTALPAPGPAWYVVVENVWNEFAHRWNTTFCSGGLKWQFTPTNQGFHYKQTISNGAFFQLSARLARFTGNQTYLAWAEKIWDWSRTIGLVDDLYNVYDGSDELINCNGVDHHQWSYNVGVFLYGSAVLSNMTASTTWMQRTSGLLDATSTFVTPFENSSNIMFEATCEFLDYCNTDQHSMKAYLVRWMAGTSIMAPYTAGRIGMLLRASAMGAVASCTGGAYGNTCGTKWYIDDFDSITGLGQQIAAMEVIGGLLVNQTDPPGTMPGVHLPPAPTSVTKILLAPMGTARPLHDPINFVSSDIGGK